MRPLATAIDILQKEENCFYGILLPCLVALVEKLYGLKKKKYGGDTILKTFLGGLQTLFPFSLIGRQQF